MRQYIAMNMFLWFVGTMAWDSLSMGRYATKAGVKRMTRGLCGKDCKGYITHGIYHKGYINSCGRKSRAGPKACR